MQACHHAGERQVGLGSGVFCGQAQRQGQAGADGGERVEAAGVGAGPFAQQSAQQVDGVGAGQQVEFDAVGAVQGGQGGESVAAGDQDEGVVGAGQQGAYLVGRGRVVQQYEESAAVGLGAPAGGPGLGVGRDVLVGYADGGQQAAERLVRGQCVFGVVAAQVEVDASVGEQLAVVVAPVDGECGLAHAGGAADDRDPRWAVGVGGVELGEFVGASGEVRNRRRELPRDHLRGAAFLLLEQVPVCPAELVAGFHAQFVGQGAAGGLVPVEGDRALACRLVGADQGGLYGFVERVGGALYGQCGDDLGGVAGP
ncbi:hypothetical protein SAMN05421811_122156 [Nonomuraea wenchangensis]|uniref:Uncharacterized protein n=1 Tax=Nonomuraea wenchangensis TaxID=568860 RepID=A0A1I0LQD1_9ACTN|nr:hypothetical protein SAMN05421811_122156 [Nonomuraea wenchangensis]